jgi:hypothetical protein
MNQVQCPACGRTLTFVGEPPSFCSYCGDRLAATDVTTNYERSEELTLPPRVASRLESADPEAVGNYRLMRLLGTGGMGRVYEAQDIGSGRHVALKLIGSEFTTSPDALERFRQEGRLASAISHPRCVFVLAAEEEAGRPYIVMELMEGKTLKDLVDEKGPMPVEQAVAKILDVIEGLQEAHRLGVIHRDVKPSNCFLESDGRVKIGDFGLAKALGVDTHLTHTGAFLGTPLYASPEQIRKDPLDHQTDVYSVAATLYFLLTGRAPFESKDAAATMARIVSDPVPSMRILRKDIPRSLDRIVLKGLERQRDRRWRDLDAFRAALEPFLPSELCVPSLGLRIGAYLLDRSPFWLLTYVVSAVLFIFVGINIERPTAQLVGSLGIKAALYAYFILSEGLWGQSLGKKLLRLKVTGDSDSAAPPGLAKAALRALVFFGLTDIPFATLAIIRVYTQDVRTRMSWNWLSDDVWTCFLVVAYAALACTMRKQNGYRALHEFLSGTRTVRLPWPQKRRLFTARSEKNGSVRCLPGVPASLAACLSKESPTSGAGEAHPADLPKRLGSFDIVAAFGSGQAERILVGQDPVLARPVWIWLRSSSAHEIEKTRQQTARAGRLRWLGNGQNAENKWDVFLAPSGVPLPEAIAAEGRLSWAEARPMLEQLTDELGSACRDGTLPETLDEEQVWIQPSGHLQMLDMNPQRLLETHVAAAGDPEQRAAAFLGRVAALLLEGRARPDGTKPQPLQAPVPEYASRIVNRLLLGEPVTSVTEGQEAFAATRDRATEINAPWRAAHLMMVATELFIPLLCMYGLPMFIITSLVVGQHFVLARSLMADRKTLGRLEGLIAREATEDILDLESPLREVPAWQQLVQDEGRRGQLQDRIAREESALQAFDNSTDLAARSIIHFVETNPDKLMPPAHTVISGEDLNTIETEPPAAVRKRAAESVTKPVFQMGVFREIGQTIFSIFIGFFPVVWILWAFLFRGGITARLMGIAILRGNGKKALRIQCAWRMLLVWLPIVLLLGLSAWLNAYYWEHWTPDRPHAAIWSDYLSWATWILAVLLLPAYALLALWSPSRSLLDRLAGTYLVPR